MFLKTFITTIVFLGVLASPDAFAYKNEGVQRVNPHSAVKRAEKEGFETPKEERALKKEFLKLKKSNPKEFEKKLSQGLENTSQYQGCLLEVKEGLQQVEKAKMIAKHQLYKKIESDWKLLKTTALNTRNDKSFSTFKSKLRSDLEGMYYIKFEDGYVFQVGSWGFVTVSKNLKNLMWRVEFNSKYDKNTLEPGAENIRIQEESGSPDTEMPLEEEPLQE